MTEQAKLTVLPKRKQKNAHMEELFTDLLTDRGSNPVSPLRARMAWRV
jgi:hypothetical protein